MLGIFFLLVLFKVRETEIKASKIWQRICGMVKKEMFSFQIASCLPNTTDQKTKRNSFFIVKTGINRLMGIMRTLTRDLLTNVLITNLSRIFCLSCLFSLLKCSAITLPSTPLLWLVEGVRKYENVELPAYQRITKTHVVHNVFYSILFANLFTCPNRTDERTINISGISHCKIILRS